ncbi:MAG: PEP-CTERM sorting domain-containing protein [Planctomycetia bacterium]|nr:PEP-CTERM sorting domain-containing protein [Planctomycetia bacterium]
MRGEDEIGSIDCGDAGGLCGDEPRSFRNRFRRGAHGEILGDFIGNGLHTVGIPTFYVSDLNQTVTLHLWAELEDPIPADTTCPDWVTDPTQQMWHYRQYFWLRMRGYAGNTQDLLKSGPEGAAGGMDFWVEGDLNSQFAGSADSLFVNAVISNNDRFPELSRESTFVVIAGQNVGPNVTDKSIPAGTYWLGSLSITPYTTREITFRFYPTTPDFTDSNASEISSGWRGWRDGVCVRDDDYQQFVIRGYDGSVLTANSVMARIVPEPGTLMMSGGLAIVGGIWYRRRFRRILRWNTPDR